LPQDHYVGPRAYRHRHLCRHSADYPFHFASNNFLALGAEPHIHFQSVRDVGNRGEDPSRSRLKALERPPLARNPASLLSTLLRSVALNPVMPAPQIQYSEKYYDDVYEYRYASVALPCTFPSPVVGLRTTPFLTHVSPAS
jgi:Cyclin-dependent kinase regulatory subunit